MASRGWARLPVLVLSLVSIASAQAGSDVSCHNNISNGTVYESATGVEFLVLCGVDYGGGDMNAAQADTFSECMDLCAETTGCVDVSYVGASCYLKRALGPLNPAGHVWTGKRITGSRTTTAASSTPTSTLLPTSDPPSCVEGGSDGTGYLTESGAVYEIICGREYYGGDLQMAHTGTFQGCIETCENLAGCVDASYVGETCYMKSSITVLVEAGHVWTAKKIKEAPTKSSVSGSVTPGTTRPSGTSPTVVPLVCSGGQASAPTHSTSVGRTYEILCGLDFGGGDIAASSQATLNGCLDACDATRSCVGVAYANGQCYLKGTLNPPTAVAHVWGARLMSIQSSSFSTLAEPTETVASTMSDSSEATSTSTQPEDISLSTSSTESPTMASSLDESSTTERIVPGTGMPHSLTQEASSSSSQRVEMTNTSTASPIASSEAPNLGTSTATATLPPTFSSMTTTSLTATAPASWPPSPDWTSNYTYYEATLPAYNYSSQVTAPATVLPTSSSCMIDPVQTPGAVFHLLDPLGAHIINRNGRPGTPPAPETEEEARAILATIDEWQPPLFRFGRQAGSSYVLELVDGATTYEVALSLSSDITFRSTPSTNPLLFTMDCRGKLMETSTGTARYWHTTSGGQRTTFAIEGSENAELYGIVAIRPELRTPRPNDISGISLRRSLQSREVALLPRCPFGPDAIPVPKPGRRPESPNGCGAADAAVDLVPDFNWGECCNQHDNCFDNCDKSFWQCNTEFRTCMRDQCWKDATVRWHDVWKFPACADLAGFYFTAVSSPIGWMVFNSANSDRCDCACDKPTHALCPVDNGVPGGGQEMYLSCQNVNLNDPERCGGCDFKCPTHTKCTGTPNKCECEQDQCGNLCLDLKSHPQNCGTCGNVCQSGFCYDGRCYEPEPTTSLPPVTPTTSAVPTPTGCWVGEAIRAEWITLPEIYSPDFPEYTYERLGPQPGLPGDVSVHVVANWQNDFHVRTHAIICPDVQYEIKFSIRNEAIAQSDMVYPNGIPGVWVGNYNVPFLTTPKIPPLGEWIEYKQTFAYSIGFGGSQPVAGGLMSLHFDFYVLLTSAGAKYTMGGFSIQATGRR
ncbi:hypothetical protein QBC40DRAFT_216824 [Triangularia verruculosa]|uniref:Apple domain-containing protein n=1 Tax=Triangularia verruculosa TaxID=2587418 RepID=A0AAN7AZD6_9PEZI|nr:hypothetical protein QBC40DRAFT_216824 [Triangularia verruculosa]